VFLNRPAIGSFTFDSDARFYYLLLAVFAVMSVLIANLRRSTTGLELAAIRSSETATATIGVSVVRTKLTAFSLSAFIAGIGGGLLATYRYIALPTDYSALLGIVWLAVVVTWGVRSSWGALVAGLALPVISQLVSDNLEPRYVLLTAVAFGLGAIGLAREPRGMLALQAQQLRAASRWTRVRLGRERSGAVE
jgi:branched-chain amino acid transport system permease protein